MLGPIEQLLKKLDPAKYFKPSTHEELTAAADLRNCTVVYPADNEVFVDCDDGLDEFEELIGFVKKAYPDVTYYVTESTTENHYHVRVVFPHDLGHYERIAYQAALGSDNKRELLALLKSASA